MKINMIPIKTLFITASILMQKTAVNTNIIFIENSAVTVTGSNYFNLMIEEYTKTIITNYEAAKAESSCKNEQSLIYELISSLDSVQNSSIHKFIAEAIHLNLKSQDYKFCEILQTDYSVVNCDKITPIVTNPMFADHLRTKEICCHRNITLEYDTEKVEIEPIGCPINSSHSPTLTIGDSCSKHDCEHGMLIVL